MYRNLLEILKPSIKYIIGGKLSFSFEERALNIFTLLSFPLLIFAAWQTYLTGKYNIIAFTLLCYALVCATVYYSSRFLKQYTFAFFLLVVGSYMQVVFEWIHFGAFQGTALFTLALLVVVFFSVSPLAFHPSLFVLTAVTVGVFFFISFIVPHWVTPYPLDGSLQSVRVVHVVNVLSLIALMVNMNRRHDEKQKQELLMKNEQIYMSQNKYQLLVESIQEEYFLAQMDLNHHLVYVSPSIYNVLGYKPNELKTLKQIAVKNSSYPDINVSAPYKGNLIYEIKVKDSSGNIRWLRVRETMTNEEGWKRYAIIQDISDAKRIEKKMREALKEEKRVNMMKDRFITMVSHQFRTPLTVVKSTCELVSMILLKQAEAKLYSKIEQRFIRIYNSIDTLNDMIDNLLIFNKLEAEKVVFNPRQTNLLTFVNKLVEQYSTITKKDLSGIVSVNGKQRDVRIDESLMEHVVSNLLSNAFKYTNNCTLPKVSIVFEENHFLLNIEDEGIGISKEEQLRLFQPFFRAKNAENIKGTGIGLAVVKEFVNLHQGEIQVESSLGKGTKFTVLIPV